MSLRVYGPRAKFAVEQLAVVIVRMPSRKPLRLSRVRQLPCATRKSSQLPGWRLLPTTPGLTGPNLRRRVGRPMVPLFRGLTLPAERVKREPSKAGAERTIDFSGEAGFTGGQMCSMALSSGLVEAND